MRQVTGLTIAPCRYWGRRLVEGNRVGRLHPVRTQVCRRGNGIFNDGRWLGGRRSPFFHLLRNTVHERLSRLRRQGVIGFRLVCFLPALFLLGWSVNLHRHLASAPMRRILSWHRGRGGL